MRKILAVMALVILTLSGCSEKNENNPQRELTALTIEGANKTNVFMVETAQTSNEMRMGLMYRKELPKNQGMIFNIRTPRSISMWMKNTYIPLDLIFVGTDKRISGFEQNAKPMSEKFITSPGDAIAVIELPAGSVKEHRIRKGDIVKHHIWENNK